MVKNITSILKMLCVIILGLAEISDAQAVNSSQTLNAKQQGIIPIAAFTAKGDLEKLHAALNEGLNDGLTVNEIEEVMFQMYAYCGFPRSLNAIDTLMAVLEERKTSGITDEIGREATPIPEGKSSYELGVDVQTRLLGRAISGPRYDFAPMIDYYLKSHLFGDIFSRDILDFQERELATISALASLPAEQQLRGHLYVSMRTGLNEAQMRQFVSVLDNKVGQDEASRASRLLDELLENR